MDAANRRYRASNETRMNWWLKIRKRRALDRDLEEEMAFHRSMRQADPGAPPFGNPIVIKEAMREMWSFHLIETILQDARYSLRGMARNPGFALIAIALLALAIGANTAMFTVVKRVLLDPLPFPAADRLVRIWQLQKQQGLSFSVTAEDYLDWAARSRRFDAIAAYSGRGLSITGEGEPELILSLGVSTNFFRVLGVSPAIGRDFRSEEDQHGRERVVVLSHALWQRKFGGDPAIVGRMIRANGEPYQIVGVMPANFHFLDDRECWSPIAFKGAASDWVNRSAHYLRVIGRMKPAESIASASAEIQAIAGQIEQQYPATNRSLGARLSPLKETVIGDSRSTILLLYAAVTLLLLIACSNIASLLIARSAARRSEFAVRAALGAGRARLFAQMLVETGILSMTGATGGIALASVLLGAVRTRLGTALPRIHELQIDPMVIAGSLALSLVIGMIFGLIPAASLPRLAQSARGIAGHGLPHRFRSALVVGQIAFAVVLLAGAGLVLRSFVNLSHVALGFKEDGVVTMGFALMDTPYPTADKMFTFARQLDQRLAQAPGLVAAGFSTSLPLSGQNWGNPVTIEGKPASPGGRPDTAIFQCISPRFLQALGAPLKSGRYLTSADDSRAPLVAMVDRSFVRSYLNGGHPVGKQIKIGDPSSNDRWRTIVGVVAESRQLTIDGDPEPHVFLPYFQTGDLVKLVGRGVYVAAHTSDGTSGAIQIVKSQISELDPNLPVRDIQLLRERVDAALSPQRIRAVLMSGFAALAALLSAVGLYGVIAFAVAQRRQEIGVRMALGADRSRITRMVLRDGLRLAAFGLAAGLTGALLLTKLIEKMLFGIGSKDAATLVSVSVILTLVAALASYLPARRASRIDPMQALRLE